MGSTINVSMTFLNLKSFLWNRYASPVPIKKVIKTAIAVTFIESSIASFIYNLSILSFLYVYIAAFFNFSSPSDNGENAFPGHYAVSHGIIYMASVVAVLSYLSYFQLKSFSFEYCAGYNFFKIQTANYKVFPKTSKIDRGTFSLEIFYTFKRKKAYLSMPVSSVGFILQSDVFY